MWDNNHPPHPHTQNTQQRTLPPPNAPFGIGADDAVNDGGQETRQKDDEEEGVHDGQPVDLELALEKRVPDSRVPRVVRHSGVGKEGVRVEDDDRKRGGVGVCLRDKAGERGDILRDLGVIYEKYPHVVIEKKCFTF